MIQDTDTFLDVCGAADFLKIKRDTVYRWAHDQKRTKFPVRHHGRRLVFLRDELKQWSDEQNKKDDDCDQVG